IYRPQFTPSCFTEAYNPATMQLSDVQIDHVQSAQVNLQATGAYGKRYQLFGLLSTIEVGGKFRNSHKYDNSYSIDYTPNDSILLNQFPNGFTNSDYYGGSYNLGYNVNYQNVRDFLNSNLGAFAADSSFGVDPANFSYLEKVSAGYVMDTIGVTNQIRLLSGIRIEV